jgi:AraC family transcriptional regulator of adaptative response/methylated-DNA-[protein]-cysteine methyltransferase
MEKDIIITLARFIEENAHETIGLQRLARLSNWSQAYVQKRFKAEMGLSPKAYQDQIRFNLLKSNLKSEPSVTEAIVESGFGSNSRVYGSASRKLGMGLKIYAKGGEGEEIKYAIQECVLGLCLMAATQSGVCCLVFDETKDALRQKLFLEFPKARLIEVGQTDALLAWITAVNTYVSQGGPRPDLPLDMRGTVFQQKVWLFLTTLKGNETLSYTQLAEKIGVPKAVRAVASACAKNRIGVLIACHKVIGMAYHKPKSEGLDDPEDALKPQDYGQYRWGRERKAFLINNAR